MDVKNFISIIHFLYLNLKTISLNNCKMFTRGCWGESQSGELKHMIWVSSFDIETKKKKLKNFYFLRHNDVVAPNFGAIIPAKKNSLYREIFVIFSEGNITIGNNMCTFL